MSYSVGTLMTPAGVTLSINESVRTAVSVPCFTVRIPDTGTVRGGREFF